MVQIELLSKFLVILQAEKSIIFLNGPNTLLWLQVLATALSFYMG